MTIKRTMWSRGRRLKQSAALVLAFASPACIPNAHSPRATSGLAGDTSDATPATPAWIAKAARVMRNGEGISPQDDMAKLKTMSRDEVIDSFMADPRFGLSVLNFNLFFLGAKPASLAQTSHSVGNGPYDDAIFLKPQATASALETVKDGDYLTLLDMQTPLYVPPLVAAPPMMDGLDPDGSIAALPAPARRAKLFALALADYDDTLASFAPYADGAPGFDREAACAKFFGVAFGTTSFRLLSAGFNGRMTAFTNDWLATGTIECFLSGTKPKPVRDALVSARGRLVKLMAAAEQLTPEAYAFKSLTDLRTLADPELRTDGLASQFSSDGFWALLVNSSTNHNRKRAAYMLKTYFCDDLTPIGISLADGTHAGDLHASDPKCQACHYKLDPMAGFFRYRGVGGLDYEHDDKLIFDDQARLEGDGLAKYLGSWHAAPATGRIWEVGYVRSLVKPSRNVYGSSLEDLMKYVRKAPEVRACLVRRMAEYFLGTEQTFDGAWLEQLAGEFVAQPTSSAKAFKTIVRQMVKSQTFAQKDPTPGVCYDRLPGAVDDGIPCGVAHVIHKNCTASCHQSTDDNPKNLDLSHLIAGPGGAPTFPHLDAEGQQLSAAVTFARLAARLSTVKKSEMMPPGGGQMSDPEKQVLWKWINDSQSALGGVTP